MVVGTVPPRMMMIDAVVIERVVVVVWISHDDGCWKRTRNDVVESGPIPWVVVDRSSE